MAARSWIDDPGGGGFGKPRCEHVDGGVEVVERTYEAERQCGFGGEAGAQNSAFRKIAENLFKRVGRGNERDKHFVADAQLLDERRG